MANPRPPKQDNSSKELAAIKAGSTVQILKQLFLVAFQVKEITPDFNTMIRMEARAAGLRNMFERNTSHLMEANMGIQANLTQLQQNTSTRELVPGFVQIFAPLQEDVKLREKERKEITDNFKTFMQNLRTGLKEIIQDMLDGKPKQEIKRKLEEIESKLNDLGKRAEKLEINESSLQERLEKLHVRTYNAVPLNVRANVQAPGVAPPKEAPSDYSKPE